MGHRSRPVGTRGGWEGALCLSWWQHAWVRVRDVPKEPRTPCCRDKGWMGGWEGALCLSWWQHAWVRVRDVPREQRPPSRTSTRPPHPPYPTPCPYSTPGLPSCRDKG